MNKISIHPKMSIFLMKIQNDIKEVQGEKSKEKDLIDILLII